MMHRLWLVAALVAAAGCAAPAPARPPDAVASTAARLDHLQRRINGDLGVRRAAEKRNYRRIEGGLAACMRKSGHPYRKVPFVSFYRDFTDADLGYGIGHATVFDSITGGGRVLILNEIAYARLARAGVIEPVVPPADRAALEACRARFRFRTFYPEFEPPAGSRELAGMDDLLPAVEADPAVVAAMRGYRGCMKQTYGYDVPDRDAFLFTPRLKRGDAPADGARPSTAWNREVAALNAALAADAACRRPAYRTAMTLLAPRLPGWEKSHREQLAAIDVAWRRG